MTIMPPTLRGHFGIARPVHLSVHPSVPWRKFLGYRHAVCLQLSHRWPPEMCGLRTCPLMDVDLQRFLDQTAIGGNSVSPPPGRYLVNCCVRVFYIFIKDTLCICVPDSIIWWRVCTQQRCLGKFRLQTLMKSLQLLIVVAAIDELFVLWQTTKQQS